MECKKCGKILTEDTTGLCTDCKTAEAERKKQERYCFWNEVNKNQSAIEDFGYRVKTEIRKSENTVIYIATNDNDETVAIKRITVPYDSVHARETSDVHEEISERIRTEMDELSKISKESGNRFVITYYDYKLVYSDESYKYDLYIKMDYLTSLGRLCTDSEYKVSDMLKMGIDVCNALEWCHKHGKVHNNINLNNIFINGDGRYVLGDFAFFANNKNEVEYCIAPELVYGEKPSASSDIYSLGMVMLDLLNGCVLSQGEPEQEAKTAMRHPRNYDLSVLSDNINSRLREVIRRAVSVRAERYDAAADLKNELEHLLSSMPEEWLKRRIDKISAQDPEPAVKEPPVVLNPLPDPEPVNEIVEEKLPEVTVPEDDDLKKKNRKDLIVLGVVIAFLVTAIAIGTVIISNAGNKKIYSLIDTESYAVAYKEISEIHAKGKNVDSLLKAYIDACCEDGEYKRVVQAVPLFSDEVFEEVGYFENILNEMISDAKYRQAKDLSEFLYKYENMRSMIEGFDY